MKKRLKSRLEKIDQLIKIRRKDVVENFLRCYFYKYCLVPDWNFGSEISSDYMLNFLYRLRENLVLTEIPPVDKLRKKYTKRQKVQ